MLEHLIRERVLAQRNVLLRDGHSVQQLLTSPDRGRNVGVEMARPDGIAGDDQLTADLVIDCTGRGSRSPRWLSELGFDAPAVSEVTVNVA